MGEPLDGSPMVDGLDKPVSKLALGTARLDDESVKDLAFDLFDCYAAHGGTVLDTGRIYGDSERLIGQWLAARGTREQMVVCTKGGHGEGGLLPRHDFEQAIDGELAQSLASLGTDYIDVYYLHRDNPAVPVGPILECLNEHVAHGRVRALGASNWTYDRLDQAADYALEHGLTSFAAVSNHLSLAVQAEPFYPGLVEADAAGRRWHADTGIPLFPWSSQARGFFTGRYRSQGPPADADGFTKRMHEVYCTEDNLERLRRAEQLGSEKGRSAVEIALAWVLHQPLNVVPIVGPLTPDELRSCVRAASVELSPYETHWLSLEA